jgi:hypothetical protein
MHMASRVTDLDYNIAKMDFLVPQIELAASSRPPDEEEVCTPRPRTRKSARLGNNDEISSLFSPSSINEMKVSVALKYGNWMNEFINAMRAKSWPEALTSLRYLYYVGKQPGEYDSALNSREAAVLTVAQLPNGFDLIFNFLLFTLDELRLEETIPGTTNGKNERKKTLFSLLRHIACIQCQQGFRDEYPVSRVEFIEHFTKAEQLDMSEWARLLHLADIAQSAGAPVPRLDRLPKELSGENERPTRSRNDGADSAIKMSPKQQKRPALSPMRVSNGLTVVLIPPEAEMAPAPAAAAASKVC